jgi:SAM-dependent methyltransferase
MRKPLKGENRLDLETATEMVKLVPWYHAFELMPGLVTPGVLPVSAAQHCDFYGIPLDLSGKDALEIGTMDGPMAFELERRGARVTAVDIQDPSRTGFNTAKAILGAHVRYVRGSVYQLPDLLAGQTFDIVLFLGVFYHLKSPILAFEQIARVLRHDQSELFIEGECLINYVEDINGQPIASPPLDFLTSDRVAVTLFYPGKYKSDDSNWFVPNLACLKGWLSAAGLELKRHAVLSRTQDPVPLQRVGGMVQRVAQPPIEHRTR